MIRPVLVLCIGIIALDAVEALISRDAGTPYAWFWIVQIVAYVAIGFVLCRLGIAFWTTIWLTALTAVVERTLGQDVAVLIGASPPMPIATQVVIVPLVVVLDCILSAAGNAFGSIGWKPSSGKS